MCRGTLTTVTSCGHHQTPPPLQPCASYSPTQDRCTGTGTVFILSTTATATDAPALCLRCALRIEANIVRERDLVAAELETSIAETSRGLWAERNRSVVYVALMFERARLREALRVFWEEREEELVELREMQGLGWWEREDDVRG